MSKHVRIVSVGKAHDTQLAATIADYAKRCASTFYIDWRIIPPANEATIEKTITSEGDRIVKTLKQAEFVILLDERGDMVTSESFSATLFTALSNYKSVSIIIGGAYGVSEQVAMRANATIAFGRMVLPHQIMRLVVSEQLYRALCIHNNNGYHHA